MLPPPPQIELTDRLVSTLGMNDFRPIAVLGRGHFGKVSSRFPSQKISLTEDSPHRGFPSQRIPLTEDSLSSLYLHVVALPLFPHEV